MSELTPHQVQKIHKLIHDKQVIQAIQVYRGQQGPNRNPCRRVNHRIMWSGWFHLDLAF